MQENRAHEPGLGTGVRSVPAVERPRSGLCDALRVELQPCQIAGAIEELEERRGPLNEAFEKARTPWDALAERERDLALGREVEEDLSRSAHALRVLTMIRSQLPALGHNEPVAVVGPSSTVSEIIAVAARTAVDDLEELIRTSPKSCVDDQARLRAAAASVVAWVDTYVDCGSLEWFTFDPPCDPSDRS